MPLAGLNQDFLDRLGESINSFFNSCHGQPPLASVSPWRAQEIYKFELLLVSQGVIEFGDLVFSLRLIAHSHSALQYAQKDNGAAVEIVNWIIANTKNTDIKKYIDCYEDISLRHKFILSLGLIKTVDLMIDCLMDIPPDERQILTLNMVDI
ncbi:hypothetical protein PS718_01648 [Pseudomonas fluorescens]|uniref:Uncharacterized protein n=1 Tax=Pseudomonas fluorescens TaxID=294 RepID=A0A5E7B975_PSEFL|nr:hypothetical protein [Pseudomonas fluorescens]VVN87959.1 hypothetical protein PS718_01648 [Pseudomonas fluorescens]